MGVDHDVRGGGGLTSSQRLRARYGAGPLHLIALLASFALAGAAVVGWFQRPRDIGSVLEWFAAAIVIHDLVLLPLYSLLDRIVLGRRPTAAGEPRIPKSLSPTPYVRVPAILSLLALAVFFPVIFGLGAQTELSASGIAESQYLARWLLASGIAFALSGVIFAVTRARAGRPPGDETPADETPPPESPAEPGRD